MASKRNRALDPDMPNTSHLHSLKSKHGQGTGIIGPNWEMAKSAGIKIIKTGNFFRRNHQQKITTEMESIYFWSKVRVLSPDECWEWQGGRDWNNYGAFYKQGERRRPFKAHRFAFEDKNGPIPDGLVICHKCDNPPCCNPTHLFAGTYKDNMQDCSRKGRTTKLHGAECHNSKLTDSDVVKIREMYSSGGETHRSLASKFGVEKNTITVILNRKGWKHVA